MAQDMGWGFLAYQMAELKKSFETFATEARLSARDHDRRLLTLESWKIAQDTRESVEREKVVFSEKTKVNSLAENKGVIAIGVAAVGAVTVALNLLGRVIEPLLK